MYTLRDIKDPQLKELFLGYMVASYNYNCDEQKRTIEYHQRLREAVHNLVDYINKKE